MTTTLSTETEGTRSTLDRGIYVLALVLSKHEKGIRKKAYCVLRRSQEVRKMCLQNLRFTILCSLLSGFEELVGTNQLRIPNLTYEGHDGETHSHVLYQNILRLVT